MSTYLQHIIEQLPSCEFVTISTLTNENVTKTITSLYQKRERLSVITLGEAQEAPSTDLVLETARLIRTLKQRATMMRIRNSGIKVIELPAGHPVIAAMPGLRERPFRH